MPGYTKNVFAYQVRFIDDISFISLPTFMKYFFYIHVHSNDEPVFVNNCCLYDNLKSLLLTVPREKSDWNDEVTYLSMRYHKFEIDVP